MSNELTIKYRWQGKEIQLSRSIVRNRIATSKNVTDEEIDEYMDLCVYRELNPFLKEAYLIKYGQERAQIVVSKDIFDLRASLDPKYDGQEITNNYKRGMNLMDLWVRTRIYHKGLSHPASDVTVHYSEYVGKKKDGTINRMWRTKPVTMITKVSKAQGKREANPKDMTRLYLTEEFDQEIEPTEKVIREIDITPKSEVKDEPKYEADPNAIFPEKVQWQKKPLKLSKEKDREYISRSEGDMADEYTSRKIETEMEIEAEVAEQEADEVPMDIMPASDKQIDFIYGTKDKKGIVDSSFITKEEVKRIGKKEKLDIEKASKVLAWWWGDKDKNIIGEREKREKNPRTSDNDFERRGQLMKEVLDLMKKNYIKKPEAKKMYKKFQKDEIIKLTKEELVELKGLLEHYVPDWK